MIKLRNALVLTAASAMLWLPTSAAADTTVKAKLVEQNGSGASGTVSLTALDNGGLKVVIRSEGLVPGHPHAQHLHGAVGGKHFGCATLEKNDTDGDGVLTNEEAGGEYGGVFMPLRTGDSGAPQDQRYSEGMPVADSEGRINYERTFSADMVPDGVREHLSSLHVVQHGIDVNNNGMYDVEALGVSTFAENLGETDVPEEETNPASCGVIEGAGMAERPRGGVETGGAPAPGLNAPLAAAGAALLVLSGAFAATAAARPRHQHSADDGQTPPS
jgi:hypothetical protein